MAVAFINKNLADKRKEIQAHIGSLERDLEQARRDLSAVMATDHISAVFQRDDTCRSTCVNA